GAHVLRAVERPASFGRKRGGSLCAVRRQRRESSIRRIHDQRRLALRLAILAPVIPRLAEEGVVRVRDPALGRELRELFVAQRGVIAKARRTLERHAQHVYTGPVALQIGVTPRSPRRRPALTSDGDGCDGEGDDDQQTAHLAPPVADYRPEPLVWPSTGPCCWRESIHELIPCRYARRV